MSWGCDDPSCRSLDHKSCERQIYYRDGLDKEMYLHLLQLPNGDYEVSFNIQHFRQYDTNITTARSKAVALLQNIASFMEKQTEYKVKK
jgi:hypothetical protein